MATYVDIRDVERRFADLIGIQTKGRCPTYNEVHEALYMDLPAVDLVRCIDCGARRHDGYCERHHFDVADDWFCSDGYE